MNQKISTNINSYGNYYYNPNFQGYSFGNSQMFAVPNQATSDSVSFSQNPVALMPKKEESFFEKHWGKILIGAGIAAIAAYFTHGKYWGKATQKAEQAVSKTGIENAEKVTQKTIEKDVLQKATLPENIMTDELKKALDFHNNALDDFHKAGLSIEQVNKINYCVESCKIDFSEHLINKEDAKIILHLAKSDTTFKKRLAGTDTYDLSDLSDLWLYLDKIQDFTRGGGKFKEGITLDEMTEFLNKLP